MQSSATGKGARWNRFQAEQAMVAVATGTVGRSIAERATTLRASLDIGEVGVYHPTSHVDADNRSVHYEATHPKRLIQWEHARWHTKHVAPYQGYDVRRAIAKANKPKVVTVTIQGKRVKFTPTKHETRLDTGAENMLSEATQAMREARAKQEKYRARFEEYRATTRKPDGHTKWCACHRCHMVKEANKAA